MFCFQDYQMENNTSHVSNDNAQTAAPTAIYALLEQGLAKSVK
jgi:hypothetical protein